MVAEAGKEWLVHALAYYWTRTGRKLIFSDVGFRRKDAGVEPLYPPSERINRWPREVMNRKMKNELSHIPRGEIKSPQNLLRFRYSGMRRHDMVYTNKEKEDTLKEAIDVVQKISPNFIPKYDKEFFKLR